MPRIRTVKPEFWTDSVIVQLPFSARLLFIGLWNFCDDQGYVVNEPDRLRMQIFPSESSLALESLLDLLVAADRLERYVSANGESLLKVKNFEKHQRVDNPSKPRFVGAKKGSIPQAVRREVAVKYGCKPGGSRDVTCYYCGHPGTITWWKLGNGKPSSWVSFSLELDHVEPEAKGGKAEEPNIILACQACNRGKATRDFAEMWPSLASPRESYPAEGKRKGSRKGKDQEEDHQPAAAAPPVPVQADPPEDKPDVPPEQQACRRAIAEVFAREYTARSGGAAFRWSVEDRQGVIALASSGGKEGVDPAEGIRLIGIFAERMGSDSYYAKNFRPAFIASVINALRLSPATRSGRPSGPGASIHISEKSKQEAETPGRKTV